MCDQLIRAGKEYENLLKLGLLFDERGEIVRPADRDALDAVGGLGIGRNLSYQQGYVLYCRADISKCYRLWVHAILGELDIAVAAWMGWAVA